MKIAMICYPSMSYTDTLAFLEPLEVLKAQQPALSLDWDYCSYLPIPNGKPGFSLITSAVGLPLQGFDVLFLPDPQSAKNFPQECEWRQWLNTATHISQVIAFHQGSQFLENTDLQAALQTFLQPSRQEAYRAGLKIVAQLTERDTAQSIQAALKLTDLLLDPPAERTAQVQRSSAETNIMVELALDGSGKAEIQTGIPFLDHMLNQIAKHGLFDLSLHAQGDLEIDPHHTMEDCALALGEAFRQAAGERKGIQRMASATIPMDESLAEVTLDFSGRPYAVIVIPWSDETLAEIPTSLFEHFLESFASAARINLFVRVLAGKDNHHISEAVFKGLAKALDQALMVDARRQGLIPSTKQVLF